GWGLEQAFTYRDANIDNDHLVGQFLGMARARSLDEFQAVFADVQGMPWVNTLAADRTGRAWYVDASATPKLSAEALDRYRDRIANDLVAALLLENRVALLDGSDPDDEWIDDPEARDAGLLPFSHLPQLERRDVVVNANDSHWLTHPDERLEGFSPLHGLEGTPRTLRTRQNLRTTLRLAAAGDLTVASALDAALDNASLSGELLRDELVARARAAGSVEMDGRVVDLAAAADALAGWDLTFDLTATGAGLWREFMATFDDKAYLDAGPLFAEAWDPAEPLDSPRGLAPAPAEGADPVLVALAAAADALATAGIALDAPLGTYQYAHRGNQIVPVHGGTECDGVCNVLSPIGALASLCLEPGPAPTAPVGDRTPRTGLTHGGYACTYGTSFLMAVELTDDGPVGEGLLAYGQSGDPRSPHHLDGTEAYAAKATRPLRFADADIEADPALVRRTVRG
ncbi:MAG: penicillin acylase family protein, partial [Acidimicrobiales bacterium]|nr:penicillin acylase family protein [Acidimicrobiales bacterium]